MTTPYTVLLLYPDTFADDFGHDTFLAHVQAEDVTEAILVAEERASDASKIPVIERDGTIWHTLFVCEGHVDDIKDQVNRTANIPLTEREMRTLDLILQDASMSERPDVQQRGIASMLTKLRAKGVTNDGR